MTDRQTEAFASGEADEYFGRNRHVAFDLDGDPIARLLDGAGLRPGSVVEIGASRGDRVAALAERYGCRGVAVDPSEAAVTEGRRAHPTVEFHVGTMDAAPIEGPFDVVLVNFVFHWVGRADLLRSVAEVDRLVADGGHLAIGDFLPPGPARTPYHHREGLWTYKQDYAEVFVASGLYCRVLSLAGRYHGDVPSGDVAPPSGPASRCSTRASPGTTSNSPRRRYGAGRRPVRGGSRPSSGCRRTPGRGRGSGPGPARRDPRR